MIQVSGVVNGDQIIVKGTITKATTENLLYLKGVDYGISWNDIIDVNVLQKAAPVAAVAPEPKGLIYSDSPVPDEGKPIFKKSTNAEPYLFIIKFEDGLKTNPIKILYDKINKTFLLQFDDKEIILKPKDAILDYSYEEEDIPIVLVTSTDDQIFKFLPIQSDNVMLENFKWLIKPGERSSSFPYDPRFQENFIE